MGVKGDDFSSQWSKHRGLARTAARLQQDLALGSGLAQFVLLLNALLDEGAAFFIAGFLADLLAQELQPLLRRANLDGELVDLQLRVEILDKEEFLTLFDKIARPRAQLDDLAVLSGIHHLSLHRHKLPFRLHTQRHRHDRQHGDQQNQRQRIQTNASQGSSVGPIAHLGEQLEMPVAAACARFQPHCPKPMQCEVPAFAAVEANAPPRTKARTIRRSMWQTGDPICFQRQHNEHLAVALAEIGVEGVGHGRRPGLVASTLVDKRLAPTHYGIT